ncbi:WXG100 family type VII secretion target [Glycomyces sp. MUSA5-2]|uniref:WXG100 family type VII secretion target n=1 Tax=Glycomyces sp. MUSA5-2 TaxID=2053002 RepID=UPI00300A216A
MVAILTADEVEMKLYDLAVKANELKALETAVDAWNPAAAAAAAVGMGLPFQAYYNAAIDSQGGVISSGDYPELRSIPELCRNIFSIDPEEFRGATELLDAVAKDMADFQGAPGNVLTKIGNWYGDAAEAFEEYFSGYEGAQARQAEMLAATVNACGSLASIVETSQESMSSLLTSANELADKMIQHYWDTQEAMQNTMTLVVLAVIAAGLSAGAAVGALALVGSIGGGVSALAGGMYSFQLSEDELSAQNLSTLLDDVCGKFTEVESAIRHADDEIFENIDALRSGWSMREVAIPAPPGADETDIESFHHESSL